MPSPSSFSTSLEQAISWRLTLWQTLPPIVTLKQTGGRIPEINEGLQALAKYCESVPPARPQRPVGSERLRYRAKRYGRQLAPEITGDLQRISILAPSLGNNHVKKGCQAFAAFAGISRGFLIHLSHKSCFIKVFHLGYQVSEPSTRMLWLG